MGLSTSTVLATGADRGLGRTLAVEPSYPGTGVYAAARNPGHPVSARGLTGVRERMAVSGDGAP